MIYIRAHRIYAGWLKNKNESELIYKRDIYTPPVMYIDVVGVRLYSSLTRILQREQATARYARELEIRVIDARRIYSPESIVGCPQQHIRKKWFSLSLSIRTERGLVLWRVAKYFRKGDACWLKIYQRYIWTRERGEFWLEGCRDDKGSASSLMPLDAKGGNRPQINAPPRKGWLVSLPLMLWHQRASYTARAGGIDRR